MLQMANQSKFLPLEFFDLEKLATPVVVTKISNTEFTLQTQIPSMFQLQIFIVSDADEENLGLQNIIREKFQQRAIVILSESLSKRIPPLLTAGAFDVMVGPPRYSELQEKIGYFFSPSYQSQIFKNHPPFHVDLTRKEQQLFEFLILHPQGVSRQEVMTLCWKDLAVHPKTLDVHLFNLRQKLEDVGVVIHFDEGKWILDYSKMTPKKEFALSQ